MLVCREETLARKFSSKKECASGARNDHGLSSVDVEGQRFLSFAARAKPARPHQGMVPPSGPPTKMIRTGQREEKKISHQPLFIKPTYLAF
jgi:hypothetical protein